MIHQNLGLSDPEALARTVVRLMYVSAQVVSITRICPESYFRTPFVWTKSLVASKTRPRGGLRAL